MDRLWDDSAGRHERPPQPSSEAALPSRVSALAVLREALSVQSGPLLITGEAGVGKTWLWRRLQAEPPGPWSWVAIDLTPAIDPADFYRLIGHGMGISVAAGTGDSRLILADFLKESAADGERWVLVVDEAQNATEAVCEEVRVLANRMNFPDGIAGLILVGQTPLARRITTRAFSALDARLSARIHLRPFDADESKSFLSRHAMDMARDDRALEVLHRDTGGNPKRLLQLAAVLGARRPPRTTVNRPISPPTASSAPPPAQPRGERPPAWEIPVVGPARPPLQVEDGVVEVGWEPTEGSEPADDAAVRTPKPELVERVATDRAEQTIHDHYAALQAWHEWETNQGRGPESAVATAELATEAQETSGAAGADAPPGVWVEGQQGFAPYSQLFSRLKPSRGSR